MLQMSSDESMKFNIDLRRVEREWILFFFFKPQACRLSVLASGTINDQSRFICTLTGNSQNFNFFLVNEITKLKLATVGNTATSYWKDLGSKLSPDTANIDFVHGFIQSFQTNSAVASLTLCLTHPS